MSKLKLTPQNISKTLFVLGVPVFFIHNETDAALLLAAVGLYIYDPY